MLWLWSSEDCGPIRCLTAMIPALRFLLLLLLSGLILPVNVHGTGPDLQGFIMKEEELGTGSCHCIKSHKAEAWIDVTTIYNRLGSSQSGFEGRFCSCTRDLGVHQQVVVATYKSWLAIKLTHAHRSFHSLFGRHILASSREPMGHQFDSKIPRPVPNPRSQHDLPLPIASPPRSVHAMAPLFSARAPNIKTTIPTASPFPGPLSHASERRHHHGKHRVKSLEPSPSPTPGPKAASSPHSIVVVSPVPDCSSTVCAPPLTKAYFVSQCSCVQPIEVELELTVPLYALFPLISVLAGELSVGTLLSPSQVEIVGANVSGQNQEFSIVDANFLPLQGDFDLMTATLISQKFWKHGVVLNRTLFGDYTVVYVKYPGLPPSPMTRGPATGISGVEKPFGVDVSKPSKQKLNKSIAAAIALSAVIAVLICFGAVWLMLLKRRRVMRTPNPTSGSVPKVNKLGGGPSSLSSDHGSFASISFCASTARLFTIAELDRATNRFAPENIIGEGGFGRVFCGVLDDGTDVAVKVLTRDNLQGGKEFIAEVEMLSRLHHRNLVKLIGICTEEHTRCLVYELISNGSVEFHLHDKGTRALDWETRLKIALGAARGLAYLHEDSSPRVIHRDFKAANILLENDFNPKVSDFGLAKVAPDGGKEHLSTRVMGTFGYVAPEYAMTGHLLVKSDVYSYGVVLLELLTGKKPVDMSQPPGQENLVTWARPLLTSMEGLQVLVDPALKDIVLYDNLAKVAAIASMCVHPEVSDRPFMGEVVQALKLVCNDFDVSNRIDSSKGSQADECLDLQSGQCRGVRPDDVSSMSMSYDSGLSQEERQPSSALYCEWANFRHDHASSSRRHSLSGPFRQSQSKLAYLGTSVRGSVSEPAPFDVRLIMRQGRDPSCNGTVRSLDFMSLQ